MSDNLSSDTSNHVSRIDSTLNEASSVHSSQSIKCTRNKDSATLPLSNKKTPSTGLGTFSSIKKTNKQRKPKMNTNSHGDGVVPNTSDKAATIDKTSSRFNKHRAQGKLTTDNKDTPVITGATTGKKKAGKKPIKKKPVLDSMATTMAYELSTSTYECMVCWDVVRPAHHTWSCDTCWAVFHVNCIEKWAKKSLEDTTTNLMITSWRCPGCQHQRKAIPKDYFCFCGKLQNPTLKHYQAPHTCDELCKRLRKCPHPCVLPCHPGPCPPCTAMGPVNVCFCGKDRRQAKCVETDYDTNAYSCDQVCNQRLGCGNHRCEETCHSGLCPPCPVMEHQTCYCGQSERNTRCGNGVSATSSGGRIGHYACEKLCTSMYDCGIHRCNKTCHSCTEPAICPYTPDLIKTCPCGSNTIEHLLHGKSRTSCTDPIPTCDVICNKPLHCGHTCQKSCHNGPCGTCHEPVKIHCRCQSSEYDTLCAATTSESLPMCKKVCKCSMKCGRHICGALCCPSAKIKGKKRVAPVSDKAHECPLVCDRLLSCGQHHCMQNCHKGPCRPCLESSSDDLSCHCGRTRLIAPVRCGSELPSCSNPCLRSSMCGHTRLLHHHCHPDNEPCPPCPVLTCRDCVCGKAKLKNIPCYREAAYCGLVCDKPLPCGEHFCQRTCHDGNCWVEKCTQSCRSIRISCGHPCLEPCHVNSTSSCPETTPCPARIRASCACGQNSMEITCHSSATCSGSNPILDCNDLCRKIQRNQRLASALQIRSPDPSSFSESSTAPASTDLYQSSLRDFYMDYGPWCKEVETKLKDFVKDDTQEAVHFKPMRPPFWQFIRDYSAHFHLAAEPERLPYQNVTVRKTLGRGSLPPILLSQLQDRNLLHIVDPARQKQSSEIKQRVNALKLTGSITQQSLKDILESLMNSTSAITSYSTFWQTDATVVVPVWGSKVDDHAKVSTLIQWKKGIQNAFLFNDLAGDVECGWVNAQGEMIRSETQPLAWGFDVKAQKSRESM